MALVTGGSGPALPRRSSTLLDGGRIDWRMVDGELRVHREFLESLRIYPGGTGLVHEAVDNAERDAVLARMEREGSLTARITLKADIRALVPVAGQEVQAWLPLPAACPSRAILSCWTAPRRGGRAGVCTTAHHVVENKRRGGLLRAYRCLFRAEYTARMSLSLELAQPDFDLGGAAAPHRLYPLPAGAGGPADRGVRQPGGKGEGHLRLRHRTGGTTAISPPTSSWTASPTSAPRPSGGLQGCSPCSSSPCAVSRASPPGGRAGWPSGPAGWAPTTGPCSTWPPTAGCGRTAPSAPPPAAAGEDARRAHYFGSLDPWRMVANSAFQAP